MSLKIRSLLLMGFLLLSALGSTSYALPVHLEDLSDVAGAGQSAVPVYDAASVADDSEAEPDSLRIEMTSDQWDKYVSSLDTGSDKAEVIMVKSSAKQKNQKPQKAPGGCQSFTGKASFYADKFNNRKTASGQRFSNGGMTAAHKTLPMGTMITVRNQTNGKTVRVRVNDRGPFVKGRIVDLTKRAANELGFVKAGHALVIVSTCG